MGLKSYEKPSWAVQFGSNPIVLAVGLAGCAWLCVGETFFMAGQGSTGNVIAALCSFFIPGLGQLIQGRLLMAIVLAAVLWIVLLGWLIHLWSILDAALWKGRA